MLTTNHRILVLVKCRYKYSRSTKFTRDPSIALSYEKTLKSIKCVAFAAFPSRNRRSCNLVPLPSPSSSTLVQFVSYIVSVKSIPPCELISSPSCSYFIIAPQSHYYDRKWSYAIFVDLITVSSFRPRFTDGP